MTNKRRHFVGGYSPDELLAGSGARHRDVVVGERARADLRRVADAPGQLAAAPARRRRRRQAPPGAQRPGPAAAAPAARSRSWCAASSPTLPSRGLPAPPWTSSVGVTAVTAAS